MSGTAQGFRVEKDTMGEVRVPADAYFGAQTQRAIDNFPISGLRFPREFIRALGIIKLAAAKANMQLGLLDTKKGDAIIKAAQEVMDGKLDGQFAVDIFQTGSGTSTNMNANEVIANRGIELLGGKRGDKGILHPNDHVNIGQSTNDVFPTAIHVSALEAIEKKLLPSLKILRDTLKAKAEEFKDVVKAGRTHLQDAVPVTLGQEFGAYASMIDHGIRRIEAARGHLSELPLGGTATGTGLNADPKFAETAIAEISRTTGVKFRKCENMFEGMQGKDAAVEASGAVRTVAVSLNKIANDIRLLNAGPRTGFGEIELPPTQPGSSIMPAKVNPVIPEAVVMVVAKILGNDVTVTFSGAAGQLELNIMMPVIAYSLLESINLEANASKVLAEKCVKGITANKELCLKYAESSLALITAISPVIGYDNSAKVAKKALSGGKTVREIVLEEGIMTKEQMDKVFNLKKMTEGGIM
ncbi:MAG: class II fumarate hydratase [Thaumarchaeota archaeon]|nr:class II fumarate hydratase [Nitrososphaerota archaeon]